MEILTRQQKNLKVITDYQRRISWSQKMDPGSFDPEPMISTRVLVTASVKATLPRTFSPFNKCRTPLFLLIIRSLATAPYNPGGLIGYAMAGFHDKDLQFQSEGFYSYA